MDDNAKDTALGLATLITFLCFVALVASCQIRHKELELQHKQTKVSD